MNFIIAMLLATTLTFAYLFLKERKKIAHKNYEIDELHKIMDEMKYGQYKKNENDLVLIQTEKGRQEYEKLLDVFLAQGKAQQQNYSYQQAAMQNAASRGNGSGYGLNNALGMLGMSSRL